MPFGFFGKRKDSDDESHNLSAGVNDYEAGLRCQNRGNLAEAAKYYGRAEKILRQAGDKEKLIMCLNNISTLCLHFNEFEVGLAALAEAESLCREIGETEQLAKVRNNQGALHLRKGEHRLALPCFEEKEKICRSIGDMRGVGASLGNQAATLLEMKEFERANSMLTEVEQICRRFEEWDGLGIALRNRAVIALRRGDVTTAVPRLKEAISAFEKAKDKGKIAECTKILRDVTTYRRE